MTERPSRRVTFNPDHTRSVEKSPGYPDLLDPYGEIPPEVDALRDNFKAAREFFKRYRLPEDISTGIPTSPEAHISVDGTHDENGRVVIQIDVWRREEDEEIGREVKKLTVFIFTITE